MSDEKNESDGRLSSTEKIEKKLIALNIQVFLNLIFLVLNSCPHA